MTAKTKTIRGTITGGYTLSPNYQALSVTSSGEITGAAGASGQESGGAGGSGVDLPLGGTVENSGSIAGGVGGYGFEGNGDGGAGVSLAASGAVINGGWIIGGASQYSPDVGGGGGDGVVLASGGLVSNSGWITGGAGSGRYGFRAVGGAGVVLLLGSVTNTGSITGGQGGKNCSGGAGVSLVSGGTISNMALIAGGAGGVVRGNYLYLQGGAGAELTGGVLVNSGSITGGLGGQDTGPDVHGGYGGAGVWLASGASLANEGTVSGAAGGASGSISGLGGSGVLLASGAAAYLSNTGLILGGASGAGPVTEKGGAGVCVRGSGDMVFNSGTIIGGAAVRGSQSSGHMGYGVLLAGVGDTVVNGSKASNAALIYGYVGVGGTAYDSHVFTLVNYGTVKGASGTSVQFDNAGDRLVVEAGSTFLGAVRGGEFAGYGTLELTSATGTINNLGSRDATLSGPTAMTFSHFGAYQIDAGGSWVLAGRNALYGSTLINSGTLIGNLYSTVQDRVIAEAGSSVVGRVDGGVPGGKSVLELASATGTLTNLGDRAGNVGTISGEVNMTVSGFETYQIDAGGAWSLVGGDSLDSRQTMINAGTLNGALSLEERSDRLIMAGGVILGGVVAGGRAGLELESGVGTITGFGGTATLSGADAMSFTGFGSFQFDAGGDWTLVDGNALAGHRTLINDGTLNGGLTLTAASDHLVLGAGAVVNGAVAGGGGTLKLVGGSGTITGSGGAETLSGAVSMSGGGFGTLVIDDGAHANWTLTGTNTFDEVSVAGVVTNAGTLQGGISLISDRGRVIIDPGSVVMGKVAATNGGGTLELAAGTGTIGQAGSYFNGFSTYKIDTGGAWSLAGSNAMTSAFDITDNGSLTIDAGVTLTNQDGVSGAGDLTIGAGATLVLERSAATSLTLTFGGAAATLDVDAASLVSSTLAGFTSGETIDLLRQAATAASVNGQDQLVVVDGSQTVATLQLTGNYAGQSFKVASDGHGGSLITVSGGGASRSPAHFAQAMAAVSAGGAGARLSLSPATCAATSPRLLSPGAPHAEAA